jgi:hypothetical protein
LMAMNIFMLSEIYILMSEIYILMSEIYTEY